MIVGELLRRGGKPYPDRVPIRCRGRDFSYIELNQRVNRVANVLLELGLSKGDRIGGSIDRPRLILENRAARFNECVNEIERPVIARELFKDSIRG